MNRLQNAVLVIWVVVLLLFVAFNWQMAWRPVEIVFLFQQIYIPVILWLVLGGIAAAGVLRGLSELEVRARRKRSDKEIHAIKAKAFDGLTREVDKLVSQLQSQLGDRAVENEAPGEKPPPAADDEEAPPQLSPETAATLAELKPSSGSGAKNKKKLEKDAEKKPKRRWRKKKT